MRKFWYLFSISLSISFIAKSQLTGTRNIPGDYPDLASAINALNTQGVGPGGVTLNLVSGNPQTAPAGGYIIGNTGSLVLTTTGSTQQVIIQGNNNVITAFSPQATSALDDGVFKIIGADWITIKNFNIQENVSNNNTAIANNNMTEWGIALLRESLTNGAQHNTVSNNTITLNRNYPNSISVYSSTRHASTSPGTVSDISSFSGSNSYNSVHSNNISNTSIGIAFISSQNIPAFDVENFVGGNSALMGNQVTNWGNNAGPSGMVDLDNTTIAGIYFSNGTNYDIWYNTIISASLNTSNTIEALLLKYTNTTDIPYPSPPIYVSEVYFNTLTLTQGGNGNIIGLNSFTINPVKTHSVLWLTTNYFINNSITGASSSASMTGFMNNCNAFQLINIYDEELRGNSSTATAGGFTGILNTGIADMNTNLDGEFGNSSAGALTFTSPTSAEIIGIKNAAPTTARISISNCSFQGFSLMSSGKFTAISNTSPVTGLDAKFNLNSFGTVTNEFLTFNGTNSSDIVFISNTNGGSQPFFQANNNSFFKGVKFINTPTSNITFITNTASVFSAIDINDNNFSNLSLNTNGNVRFIENSTVLSNTGTQVKNFNNNILNGLTRSNTGVFTTFIETTGAETAGITLNIKNNVMSNVTISGTPGPGGSGLIFGIRDRTQIPAGSSPQKFIENNQITNISGPVSSFYGIREETFGNLSISGNTLSNLSSYSSIYGISVESSSGPSYVTSNSISSIRNTVGGLAAGIRVTGTGGLLTISKNKIYDLETNGSGIGTSMMGISIVSGFQFDIDNNIIGDVRAPNGGGVYGMFIIGGSTVRLFYNTVWLNTSSSFSPFGSRAIYVSMSSPMNFTLRNNILVNTSVASGSEKTVAFGTTGSPSLATYNAASNNNLFYAGTPGPSNVIYFDGTNSDQTLAAFKTRVSPRDNLSISENPVFISNIGSNPGFLHIDPSVATAISGGASPVAGFTTDFDNETRHASTPDIGADEFTSSPGCLQPTNVAISLVTATSARISFSPTGVNMILEYGPSGFTPGTAASPGAGGTIVSTNSSPVNLTGLSSSTNYDVYVRRVCTSPAYSANSVVASFGTPHANDEAFSAQLLTVNAGCSGAPYFTNEGTASVNEAFPSCSGTKQSPIWFKFVAPASGAVRISTDLGSPTLTNSKLALFSATNVNDYASFSIISCDDNGGSNGSGNMSVLYATNLSTGTTYYIAVDRSDASVAHGTFCMAVDELSNGMLSQNTNCISSYQVPFSNGINNYTGWIPLLDGNSRLMAMVNVPGGVDPSLFTLASQHINTGAVRSSSGTEYLDRNFLINGPANNAYVRFFFLSSEMNNLMGADPSVTLNNLGASRQPGTICQNDFSPLNGQTLFLSQMTNSISADGSIRWIQVNTPGFSNFYLKGSLGGTLPINILSFSGQRTANAVKLKWSTSAEQNNRGFEIQRSANGINYAVIGFVNSIAAGGTSSQKLDYEFNDLNVPAGKLYYRLKQIDLDNNSRLSQVVVIKAVTISQLTVYNIYPNPATAEINLMIESPAKKSVQLKLIDANGSIVLEKSLQVLAGFSTVPINIRQLAAGVYIIKAETGSSDPVSTQRFVKY